MRRFIGHAVAGTMFLTVSVWWFIGEVLQINRRSETLRAKYKQPEGEGDPTDSNSCGINARVRRSPKFHWIHW